VARALIELGVPHEDSIQSNEPNTVIFDFPVHNPTPVTANELTALEQLEVYKLFMDEYVDHNASVSIYFGKDEIPAIARWLDENWDSYVAVSFFPRNNGVYRQAPKEAITATEYEERVKALPDLSGLEKRVAEIEAGEFQAGGLEDDCEGGICPVR